MREMIINLICKKARPVWVVVLAAVAWLLLMASLETYYRFQISRFEKKLSNLTVGMTEGDMLRVLGKPESINSVAYYWPTEEQVPPGREIVDYSYSMRSLQSYTIRGIYFDAKSKRLVRLSPHRSPDFFIGSWPSDMFIISFLIFTALAWIITKRLCLQRLRK
jgi:hypothetical protein